jgi:hypothetical protein
MLLGPYGVQLHTHLSDKLECQVYVPAVYTFRVEVTTSSTVIGGEGHPRTGHESQDWKERYSSNISLTSAPEGLRHAPAALFRK